jgi:hypothetical protein
MQVNLQEERPPRSPATAARRRAAPAAPCAEFEALLDIRFLMMTSPRCRRSRTRRPTGPRPTGE